jgi:2-dehydro-3-deoxy-D-gluconate 5-dehydrogenase
MRCVEEDAMTFSLDLTGKTAVVTGANTGLGQGISVALAQAGASIVGVGRSSMAETEGLCREAGVRFHGVQADLATLEPIERIIGESMETSGRIDILVNNAGIIRRADAIEFSEKDWDDVMNVNLKSTFFLTQAVARTMLADGGEAARSSISPRFCLSRAAFESRPTRQARAALQVSRGCLPANGRQKAST